MSDDAGPWGACPVCNVLMKEPWPHHSGKCYQTSCGHTVVRAEEPIEYPYYWREYRF